MGSEILSRLDVYYCDPCKRVILMSEQQQDWEVVEFKKKFYVHYVPGDLNDSLKEKSIEATADRTYLVYEAQKHAAFSERSRNGNYEIAIQFHTKNSGPAKSKYLEKHHGKMIEQKYTSEIPKCHPEMIRKTDRKRRV
jgi:hypothetical protein